MSNHLSHLLSQWYPNRDNCAWVLGTIYHTEGPCYRKAGAMMLFSSQGEQLGMLSGGCLESDIAIQARKVMQTGQSMLISYDGSDEDDLSFHLGIGCGGSIYIMLQQINNQNNYLSLVQVFEALKNCISGYYYQSIVREKANVISEKSADIDSNSHEAEQAYFEATKIHDLSASATLSAAPKRLVTPIIPEPHLLVVGGGIDARPLVNMARELGWIVSLWDPRPANARREYFPNANYIIKGEAKLLTNFVVDKDVSAAVLLSHSVAIDADALTALASCKLKYLSLLGPNNRKQQVVAQANINEKNLPFVFAGPSGLDLGGSLPESIALAILSECHASLYNKKAQSLSQVL